MATEHDHDNHRNLNRIADALEHIAVSLATLATAKAPEAELVRRAIKRRPASRGPTRTRTDGDP